MLPVKDPISIVSQVTLKAVSYAERKHLERRDTETTDPTLCRFIKKKLKKEIKRYVKISNDQDMDQSDPISNPRK